MHDHVMIVPADGDALGKTGCNCSQRSRLDLTRLAPRRRTGRLIADLLRYGMQKGQVLTE